MNCAEGYPRPLGFWNLLKVTYRLNILGILLRPHLDHWIFFTKQCILFECPLYKRYGLACTSMGCVIVTVSSFPPSLPLSPWWTGVLRAALCGSVCVWLWENFSTVRESPPLSGPAFPLGRWGGGPLCSEMLSPTTPPGPFLPQQILVVEVVAEFLCPVFRFPNWSYLHYHQAQE